MISISLNEKLNLPGSLFHLYWSSPWASALCLLGINFGVGLFCNWVLERTVWRQYFWSVIIGDLIGLPLIAYCSTSLLQHLSAHHLHTWYTSVWWYGFVLGVGVGIIALVTYRELHWDFFNLSQELSPSKLWHTLMWPVYFWLLVAPAPAALTQIQEHTAFTMGGVIVGIAIWMVTLTADFSKPVSPLGGVVEFSWRRFLRGEHPATIRLNQWHQARQPLPHWFYRHYDPLGRPRYRGGGIGR